MAQYTVAELKDLTSVRGVNLYSDAKILNYQASAEAMIDSLDPDTTISGYTDAKAGAILLLFDWIASNPAGFESARKGKLQTKFMATDLPAMVQQLLQKYVAGLGSSSPLEKSTFEREGIGLS